MSPKWHPDSQARIVHTSMALCSISVVIHNYFAPVLPDPKNVTQTRMNPLIQVPIQVPIILGTKVVAVLRLHIHTDVQNGIWRFKPQPDPNFHNHHYNHHHIFTLFLTCLPASPSLPPGSI